MKRIKERIETSAGVQWVTGYSRKEIEQKKRAIIEEDIRRSLQLQVKTAPLFQAYAEAYMTRYKLRMQIVTATGQKGHNSGPARDTIAGRKLSQYPARKAAFLYNGRTSFSEEESIMRRSVYGLQESAHSSFHQWNEQQGDRGDHR